MKNTEKIQWFQRPDKYREIIARIGCMDAARDLYQIYQEREEHGLMSNEERIVGAIRIDLLSRGIY